MGEYLRMVNVSADCGRGAALHHFYLSIWEGEILFLAGIHWSGKPTVKSLLLGQTEAERGRLYVDEEPCRGQKFENPSVMCVDRKTRFCERLTIQENLLSLQKSYVGRSKTKRAAREEMRELLTWAGIRRDQNTPVSDLTEAEKVLLWMALARVRWVRLLILDCIGCAYSQPEIEALSEAILKLREEGISVMIMDEHENGLLPIADRAVILKKGMVGKVLYPDEYEESRFLTYMTGFSELPTPQWEPQEPGDVLEVLGTAGGEELTLREKQVIGISDAGWPTGITLPEYLQQVCRNERWPDPAFLQRRDTVYITEKSEEQLFSSMDIGDNIALVASRRLGGRLQIMRPGIRNFLQGEFLRKFDIKIQAEIIEDLTCKEKKLLSIYRWELTRPRLWLMENPLLRISLEDRPHFKEYLRELAADGSCLLVAAHDDEELRDFCDEVLYFLDGQFQGRRRFHGAGSG